LVLLLPLLFLLLLLVAVVLWRSMHQSPRRHPATV
jgi:hypothetical protein